METTPTAVTINVQDEKEISILLSDDEATLNKGESGNTFQDTSSEELTE